MPRAVVGQAVRHRANAFQEREMLEQRITRTGDEHFVAGVDQELEEKSVGFARARGEHEIFGVDRRSGRGELRRDRTPRRFEPEGGGLVA